LGLQSAWVSYGGALNLFGYKGAKPLQAGGAEIAKGEDDHCVVPTKDESTLTHAEMHAWAKLSGSSWVRLAALNADRTEVTLDRAVPDWEPGDQIVVGTTDWYPGHSEVRTIRKIAGKVVTVCRPVPNGMGPGGCCADASCTDPQRKADALDYPHSVAIFDAKTFAGAEYTQKDLNRTAVDLRAPVGLLSRSIQIRSLGTAAEKPFPNVSDCLYKNGTAPPHGCYFGGHVMVRQGFKEAQIQGVEFKQLGQGGRIGHYPVHFHLAKSTAYTNKKAFVKDSSIWDSMTRFAVLHGTHGVTLARNVGFASIGNGFYIEDGSEIDNRLCYNLGVSARASLKEFFTEQAKEENWTGSPKAPSLIARYVPPILDGVCGGPNATDCPCQHPGPVPTPVTTCTNPDGVRLPELRLGSDAIMPVMFWAMNARQRIRRQRRRGRARLRFLLLAALLRRERTERPPPPVRWTGGLQQGGPVSGALAALPRQLVQHCRHGTGLPGGDRAGELEHSRRDPYGRAWLHGGAESLPAEGGRPTQATQLVGWPV
jgi:hypothetical protein